MSNAPASEAHPRAHLPALTSLRGIAALWVVLYHFQDVLQAVTPLPGPVGHLIKQGNLAVDLFFLLSGYVLAYNYLDAPGLLERGRYTRFLLMRLARIYPAHLVGLLGVVPMVVAARVLGLSISDTGYSLSTFLQHLTLTQAWVPWMGLSWNYPAWSVSAEWFAYLLFPWLAAGVRRVRGPTASLLLLAGCTGLLVLSASTSQSTTPFHELLRVGLAFPTGVALFHATRGLRVPARLPPLVALASMGGLVLALAWEGAPPGVSFALFTVMLWALASLGDGQLRWLSARPLTWLGEVSYSLYISHALVQKLLNETLPAKALASHALPVRLLGLGLYAVLLLAAAYALWRLVETPARRAVKDALERRAAPEAPTPAPHPSAG